MRFCAYCEREIPPVYQETELAPGITVGLAHEDELEFRESEQPTACMDCRAEITEFTEHLEETGVNAFPHNHEFSLDLVSGCSVCGDKIGELYGYLLVIDDPFEEETENHYISCEPCWTVISNFLEELPEKNYAGDLFLSPSELGWRAHQYIHHMLLEELAYADLVRVQRAVDHTRSESEEIHKNMFQNLISKVANERGRGSTATVSFDIGYGGGPIEWSIELLEDSSMKVFGATNVFDVSNYRKTSITVPIPPVTPQNSTVFAERIRPTLEQIEQDLESEYHLAVTRTDATLADLEEHEPEQLEKLKEHGIPELIQELSEKTLSKSRS